MTRKGEIDIRRIQRQWPHHVALPAEALRGSENSMAMYRLAKTLSGAPRPYHMRRDGRELVVFCFAKPEDATVFAKRFGGELIAAGN